MYNKEACKLVSMRMEHLHMVWNWRNDERIRKYMHNSDLIPLHIHKAWFTSAIHNERFRGFIFSYEEQPIGFVSFKDIDLQSGQCSWGFYVGQQDSPRGMGSILCFTALEYAFENMHMNAIDAEIKANNIASLKVHNKMGFLPNEIQAAPRSDSNGIYRYRLTRETWFNHRNHLEKTLFSE